MLEEEKTDSESSCLLFGKRKAVTRKNELRLQKIRLETPWVMAQNACRTKGGAPPRGFEKPYQTKKNRKKYIFSLTNTFQKGFPYQNTESLFAFISTDFSCGVFRARFARFGNFPYHRLTVHPVPKHSALPRISFTKEINL